MKRKYALVGVAIFCVFAVSIIYWRVGPPIFVPSNFNSPAPSPTPCIRPLESGDKADTVCGIKCGLNVQGQLVDSASKWVCCPAGFDPEGDVPTVHCIVHK